MDARNLKSREYNTDIFNVRSGASNGGAQLYDPHPFLKDRQHSDNRTRTSFQDSNIFGYKEGNNVTWQGTGRLDKPAGIKSGTYVHAHHSNDNVIYDPAAGMASSLTQTRDAHMQPTPDMYKHNDPQVPKSRLGEEIFGVKQFDRQAVRSDLLPQDEYWLRRTTATKNTAEAEQMRPEERRQRELHSTYSNIQPSGYEAKPKELKHETLAHWMNPHKSDKRSNVPQEVNTFEKRAAELASTNNPLTHTDYSEYTPKTKKQESYEDVEKRVKDAFYSDLYGQTGHYGPKSALGQRSEVHSMTGIFSKEGATRGNIWTDDVSAAQRKQDFLRTSGFPSAAPQVEGPKHYPDDHEINMAKSQMRMPKVIKGCELQSRSLHTDEFNERYNVVRDNRETNVISLRFTNLPREMDADTLKAIAGAKHVVRSAVQTDNIKNECTGQGEITIRLFENETKEDIVGRFHAAGLNAEDKPEASKKKSNYKDLASTGWRDSRLEFEEKRHINSGWENDKLSKVQNLSTNVPMGSNEYLSSLGKQYADVVRNRQDGLYQAQNDALSQNQTLVNWNNMRPQTAGPSYGASAGANSGFMRPTESFNTRTRQVQDSLRKRYY